MLKNTYEAFIGSRNSAFLNSLGFLVMKLWLKLRGRSEYDYGLPYITTRRIFKRHSLLTNNDVYKNGDHLLSWWFLAYLRFRNYRELGAREFLRYFCEKIDKKSSILVTGCGTCMLMLHLFKKGFVHQEGFDYLPQVVQVAKDINRLAKSNFNLWQDDGFHPLNVTKKYDVVVAVHWVFSAWKGNYFNKIEANKDNIALLREFLLVYTKFINPNGYLMIELVDSYASPKRFVIHDIYPIRHSYSEVESCARDAGYSIEKTHLCTESGWEPRIFYVLRFLGSPEEPRV